MYTLYPSYYYISICVFVLLYILPHNTSSAWMITTYSRTWTHIETSSGKIYLYFFVKTKLHIMFFYFATYIIETGCVWMITNQTTRALLCRMLTYADVCWRKLTYTLSPRVMHRMLTWSHPRCQLTYADVC